MTNVLVGGGRGKFRRREESDVTKEADIGVRHPQSQEHEELCEAGGGRGRLSPSASAGTSLRTPLLWPVKLLSDC